MSAVQLRPEMEGGKSNIIEQSTITSQAELQKVMAAQKMQNQKAAASVKNSPAAAVAKQQPQKQAQQQKTPTAAAKKPQQPNNKLAAGGYGTGHGHHLVGVATRTVQVPITLITTMRALSKGENSVVRVGHLPFHDSSQGDLDEAKMRNVQVMAIHQVAARTTLPVTVGYKLSVVGEGGITNTRGEKVAHGFVMPGQPNQMRTTLNFQSRNSFSAAQMEKYKDVTPETLEKGIIAKAEAPNTVLIPKNHVISEVMAANEAATKFNITKSPVKNVFDTDHYEVPTKLYEVTSKAIKERVFKEAEQTDLTTLGVSLSRLDGLTFDDLTGTGTSSGSANLQDGTLDKERVIEMVLEVVIRDD